MAEGHDSFSLELFQHAEFLKRLARGILGDEHLAEDAVQDAFVAALERPPRAEGALPAWLASVARHLAINRRRSEAGRVWRERASARTEQVDADLQAAEQLELQRFLSDVVSRLDEAKRTAIYLRYSEGLEPKAIAARLDVPVKTVKTRLARALEELRQRLDARSGGDRGGWVPALVSLTSTGAGAPMAATGGLPFALLLNKATVALALVLAAWLMWPVLVHFTGTATIEPRVANGPVEPVTNTAPVQRNEPTPEPSLAAGARAHDEVREGREALRVAVTQDAASATLTVQALAKESGAPLAQILLTLQQPAEANEECVTTRMESSLTDRNGRVEFSVPSARALEYELEPDAAFAGGTHIEVPALAPGEQREIVVLLPTLPDVMWFGQVLDGELQVPIADASVELVTGDPFGPYTGQATARSASDGTVQVSFASWRPSSARIDSEGYATGFVTLDSHHTQPASAFPVRLLRPGTLELSVTDRYGAPREGLEVRVSFEPYERLQGGGGTAPQAPPFRARTDAAGRCEIGGLPPELPLAVELLEDEKLLRREDSLRLEPGERHLLDWSVGERCVLRGRTIDAQGSPVENATVWLARDSNNLFLRDVTADETVAETRSDPDGLFRLEIGAGSWRVGLAPDQRGARSASGLLEDIAPVATRVVIEPDQTSAELTLTCWCGLFLSGAVTGPDGEPLSQGNVQAWQGDTFADASVRGGAFSIGPLPPGSYALNTIPIDAGLVDSERRSALAGTTGIEIRLRRGASLSARILDSHGSAAVDAVVWILSGRDYGNRIKSNARGEAQFDNLPPLTFSISATTADGEFALERGVTIPAGSASTEIELHLAPAPRLRIEVRNGPEVPMQAVVFLDGAPISLLFLEESPATALAPGDYEIALWGNGPEEPEEVRRQAVHLEAAAETLVVFDLAERR